MAVTSLNHAVTGKVNFVQLYCPFWLLLPDLFLSYYCHCLCKSISFSFYLYLLRHSKTSFVFIYFNHKVYFIEIKGGGSSTPNKFHTQYFVKNYSHLTMFDLIVAEHHLKIQSEEYL
ncbi:hypothetical protein V8G54_028834 [Vigna mungo]|uniref:Uncharacterized protein n=1 Tax=Vigna mungo TaxID=3915 RepID=A0AAQ3MTI0_VIGMU